MRLLVLLLSTLLLNIHFKVHFFSCLSNNTRTPYLIRQLSISTGTHLTGPGFFHHLTCRIFVGDPCREAHATTCGAGTPFSCLLNTVRARLWCVKAKGGFMPVCWRQMYSLLWKKYILVCFWLKPGSLSWLTQLVGSSYCCCSTVACTDKNS